MEITKVEARRYSGDTKAAYVAEIVIVTVHTDVGVSGSGFASAPPGVGGIFQQLIENVLARHIVGADPRLISDLWDRMHDEAIPRRGGDGLARFCIAAIDMARSGVTCNAITPFARTRVTDIIQPANSEQEIYKERALKVPTENVADLTTYLCTPAASEVTGQIFGVRGREVFVFSQPKPVARVIAEGKRWRIDDLAGAVDNELRDEFSELITDLEYFNMEPSV